MKELKRQTDIYGDKPITQSGGGGPCLQCLFAVHPEESITYPWKLTSALSKVQAKFHALLARKYY